MEFRTQINIPHMGFSISHQDKMMMIGSCFAQNIGTLLLKHKFDLDLNPYGVLYNPASISKALHRLLDKKYFESEDLFEHKGVYQSFWHHSSFSGTNAEESLSQMNHAFEKASQQIEGSSCLFITFGTSYVFEHREGGGVVGNCHKLPSSVFKRYRLTVSDIVDDWTRLIERLRTVNPQLRTIFTVSPIRHLKDGLHDNQLSKSTLLLAIDELCNSYENCFYFPAYEAVLDDLRDYRFYDEDMLHPNRLAVRYIWELFGKTYFDKKTERIIAEWAKLQMSINHRPSNANTSEYKQFLNQTLEKIISFQQKYPYICCENELQLLKARRQGL